MRKSLAKIAALLLVLVAIAAADETAESKTLDTAAIMKKVYNFRGGINFSSTWSSRSVLGFHVGGMVDIPLAIVNVADDPYLLEFHPGAQFIKKGGRLWYYSTSWGWGRTFDAYYLEVPVFLSVKRTFSEFVSGRIDFGPYFAFGLFGTNNSFDSEYGLDRFDTGMMYGITIDFAKRYSIGVHQGTGLSSDNISSVYMTLSYKL